MHRRQHFRPFPPLDASGTPMAIWQPKTSWDIAKCTILLTKGSSHHLPFHSAPSLSTLGIFKCRGVQKGFFPSPTFWYKTSETERPMPGQCLKKTGRWTVCNPSWLHWHSCPVGGMWEPFPKKILSPFFFFLATDRQTKGGIKRIVFGWNRFKCIHLKHSISRPELSLTPSTFHMWPHLIFTQTGRYYYHLTDIQTEIQVKEIAGKRNVSTPKRGTNSLIQL